MSDVKCRLCGVGILHSGTCYCHVTPRMFIARVPYVWGSLLEMTEETLQEKQIVRERRKDGPPYCYEPVPVDDPLPFMGDSRYVSAYEVIDGEQGAETSLECCIMLRRCRIDDGLYELSGNLGETCFSICERWFPIAIEMGDMYGRPTIIRIHQLANIPRSPLERLADQAE